MHAKVVYMVALQIRDVPDDVNAALKARAAAAGQSLQGYLLALVQREAARGDNAAILARFRGRDDGIPSPGDTIRVLMEAREERDEALGQRPTQ
jgi:plasmid stability protein